MDRRSTPSDEDNANDEEFDEDHKTSLAAIEEEIGGDERRRRQLQQASRRSRKRQKNESTLCASQLSGVRSEIAELQRQLAKAARSSPDQANASKTTAEQLELEQRISFLKHKLEAHEVWLLELRNLLAAAPFLDYALRLRDAELAEASETIGGLAMSPRTSEETSSAVIDEWRTQAAGHHFSPLLITKHITAAVSMSQDNVDKLLDEFLDPASTFGVTFSSRGWSHAANIDDKLFTFRSCRVIPAAAARTIAASVWRSLQMDDVFRTFVPLVQDAVVVYEAESPRQYMVERVVQFETPGPPEAIATIESMHEYGMDGTSCWRIAMETCDDPCLIAYASERISTVSSQTSTFGSPVIQSAGKNLSQRPDIVLAAKCFQHASGVCLQFAGSIRHNCAWTVDANSAVDLVQYLVGTMPAYEELHLLSKT